MSCALKVVPNVVNGSLLEYFCDGNGEAYSADAKFGCEKGDHHENWHHNQIASPAIESKTLSASCQAYAIDATVRVFSSDETTVEVIARITPPGGEATRHVVCTVVGKNGIVEFPRLLVLMA